MHLRAKQILVKTAKKTHRREERISRREIEKKVSQIKFLSEQDQIPKTTLRKEIINLEQQLRGVLILEKKMKEKSKQDDKKIKELKNQITDFKKKLDSAKDVYLRRKVNRLSHLINDMMAHHDIKKEVRFEKVKKKKIAVKKEEPFELTLKKIDELKNKISALQQSGNYDPEKIAALDNRLTEIEKKFDPSRLSLKPETVEPAVKEQVAGEFIELEQDIDELPLPPPPRMIKR